MEAQANGEYHVEVNNFTDWSEEERAALSTYRNPEILGVPLLKMEGKLSSSLGAPPSLNYNTLGKVTPVKNQGSCGSCWAFSTTAQYESLLAIHNNTLYNLAEQDILDCTPNGSCNGGYPIEGLKAATSRGISLESAYPYKGLYMYYGNGICTAANKIKLPNTIKNVSHYGSLTDSQLKDILAANGPVSVGVAVNNAFQFYSGGVFSGCSLNHVINHAVLLVGYTAEGNWIIKNSWGLTWG